MSTHGIVLMISEEGSDRNLVGNKAAQLAALLSLGYDVPPGVVLTDEFEETDSGIHELVGVLDAARIPGPWAVRSSSTAEDGLDAAFPGVFVSVLGVSEHTLQAAIRQVRASLTADTAQAYVRGREFDLTSYRMAVIVQPLVDASVAGVAFSRDPVTMADAVGVEASWGLGEPIVSGDVTPDSWTVENGTIIRRQAGTKRLAMFLEDGVVVRRQAAEITRSQPCLTDSEVLEIAAMTQRLESDLMAPQDVEWALTRDRALKLLQARPITTGAPT